MNEIICGDSLEVMQSMQAGTFDLVVTSPPYNLKNSTGNGMKDGRGGKWSNAALLNGYENYDDNMPYDKYIEWQIKCLNEMMRLINDKGAIFYNHKWRVQNGLIQDRREILSSFPVRQVIIWKRKGGFNFNAGYFVPTYEVIYLICKEKFKLSKGSNSLGDVWEVGQEKNNPHPAPFPLEIAKRCVSSSIGDMILDPFAGSGTTALACKILNKNCVSIDISEKYCHIAKERIS